MDGKLIKLMIWDIPKEKFHSLTKTYYQDTHGVIITFDITDINSFKSVRLWKKEFDDNMPYEPVKILVGNKCDKSEREVSPEEGNSLSKDFNMKYFETSAKTNQNINDSFAYLIREIIKAQESGRFIVKEEPKPETKNQEKGGCILY